MPINTVIANPEIDPRRLAPTRGVDVHREVQEPHDHVADREQHPPARVRLWPREPAMKMNSVAGRRYRRNPGESSGSAFVAHTTADHAHHTSANTSIERLRPGQVSERESGAVTCVTA
jgi:hypothetical protein